MPKSRATKPSQPVMSGMIRARIDPDLKNQAETILSNLGLSASDAIRWLYKQVVLSDGLPFPIKISNSATHKAIKDADADKVTRHTNAAEMFKKLDI